MKDKNDKKIQKNNYVYINKKRNPKVGIVVEEEGKLKCFGLYPYKGQIRIGDKIIAILNKYDSEDIEIITKEEVKDIVLEME